MTTSSDDKAAVVKERYGVTATVNYRDSEWPQKVKEITNGAGVDVIVDVVGGETLARSLPICNYGARIAVIGVLGGGDVTLHIRDLLSHQVQLRGIYMESTEELRAFMRAVDYLKLTPVIDRIFPFEQAQEAYRLLESQKHIGKVVITIGSQG